MFDENDEDDKNDYLFCWKIKKTPRLYALAICNFLTPPQIAPKNPYFDFAYTLMPFCTSIIRFNIFGWLVEIARSLAMVLVTP